MSLKKRFGNIAAAFLMVLSTIAPIGNGFTNFAYADETVKPVSGKTIKPNDDGTYTISLSVTGTASSTSDNTKANIVVVYDTSASMKYPEPSNNTGRYGYAITNGYALNSDNYRQLYYCSDYNWFWNRCDGYSEVSNGDNHDTVYTRSGNSYSAYTGPRYDDMTATQTRADVAENALISLGNKLLNYNTSTGVSDMVEIAFVDFSTTVNTSTTYTDTPTTSKETFASWVSSAKPKDGNNGGTNWEAALSAASNVGFGEGDNDKTYVIFVSDGNPTFRTTKHCTGRNCSDSDDNNQTPSGVHGSGHDDPNGWNLSDAQTVAASIINANKTLYTVGVFGDASNMQNLNSNAIYKDATNQTALEAAFNDIVNSITNSLTLEGVSFNDGVTDMTSIAAVEGEVSNFKYYIKEGDEATEHEWATAPHAKYEDGHVIWNVGELADGTTARVEFVVWPSQEAYDTVAKLNNNEIEYDADTMGGNIRDNGDGTYSLYTNQSNPRLDYTVVTRRTDASGNVISETKVPGYTILTNPDPVALTDYEMNISKHWKDELDTSQRLDPTNPITSVKLDLYRDSEKIRENLVLSADSTDPTNPIWTLSDDIHIAPGVMISKNSDTANIINADGSYNDKIMGDYIILESGHEYWFEEHDIDYHFELTKYTYHPMLVDGVLKNVIFTKDSSGNITGIESVDNTFQQNGLYAENTIKGGVNLTKKIVDEEGNEITDIKGIKDEFNFEVSLLKADGDPAEYDYRIYYGVNNPNYVEGSNDNRSGHICSSKSVNKSCGDDDITGTPGTFSQVVYAGDTIRIINMDSGTLYYVNEVNVPVGYSFEGVSYEISEESNNNFKPNNEYQTIGSKDYRIVHNNSAANAIVTNKYTSSSLKLSKTVEGNPSKEKNFTFTVNLTDASGKKLESEYPYTGKINNQDVSGKIVSGDTIDLGDGDYIVISKLPVGAKYTITEESKDGYTTEVKNNNSTGEISSVETDVEFINTYHLETISTRFVADKQFNDWTGAEDEVFYFILRDANGNQIGDRVPVTKDNKAATFEIEYDAPGEYVYTISEDTGDDYYQGRHVNVDTEPNTLTVTVKVEDDGEGHLTIDTEKYPEFEGNKNTIINTYTSSGSLTISAGKVLTGREWINGDVFAFDLFDLSGDSEKKIGTVTLDNDEVVPFDQVITYDQDDVGKTFVYVIREDESQSGHGAGMTNKNPDGVKITVTLTDDHQGNITVTVKDEDDNDYINAFTGTIENEYKAEETDAIFNVTKTVTDTTNTNRDGEFEFELYEGDTLLQTKKITTNNLSGNVSFNQIKYTEVGTHTYTVVEKAGNTNGFSYDETVHTIVVTITDDPINAQLIKEVKVDGVVVTDATAYTVAFENTFEAEPVTIEAPFKVKKNLTGIANDIAKNFIFDLSGSGTTDSVTIKGSGEGTFKNITYTKAGTYTYTITERNTNESGYTYDSTVYTVTVVVSDDNEDGKLEIASITTKKGDQSTESIEFNNSYAASGSASISVKKAFAGADRDWDNETFTFSLDEGDSNVGTATASKNTNWIATFDEITYTEAGTYTYTISENNSGLAGVTSSKPITVTVEVEDNGDGTLTAEVQNPASLVITNTYTTDETNVTLHVEKTIDDQSESNIDGTFTFILKDETGEIIDTKDVTTTDGKGTLDFKNIVFKTAGEYHYTIVEQEGDQAGFTYNTKVYEITITVTDHPETATLSASVKIDGVDSDTATAKVTNVYKATEATAQFEVEKTLTGLNADTNATTFEFILTGDGIDGQMTTTITVDSEGKGTAKFEEITYDKAGEYHYTISEKNGEVNGYTYDQTTYDITVTVVDNGEGKLVANTVIKKNGEEVETAEFKNKYSAEGVITLKASKALEGREWLEGETHQFVLKDKNGNIIDTKDITSAGEISFDSITYTASGSYEYTIEEILNPDYPSLTADGTIKVVVNVTDNSEGKLSATASYTNEGTNANSNTITNSYTATGSVEINVTKSIEGRDWLGTDEFTFELFDSEGNSLGTKSVTKDADTATFTIDTFTQEDVGKTITYTVKEIVTDDTPLPAGMDKLPEPITITVTVADNGDGTLAVTPDQQDGYTIVNTYKAEPVDVIIHVDKEIIDESNSNQDGTFVFKLKYPDGEVVSSAVVRTEDLKGGADFDKLIFTAAGVYEFELYEVDGGVTGFTYDTTIYNVIITVTDNNAGKLEASVEIGGKKGNSFTITNTYKATEAEVILDVEKILIGMSEGVDPVDFSFTLSGDGIEDQTITIDKNMYTGNAGYAEFDSIFFDKVGTYTYTISEINDQAPGYTYDEGIVTVTIDVVDENGYLVTYMTFEKDGEETDHASFMNEYSYENITITPEASKILLGRDLKDGEFAFEVYLDGELVATGYNNADGTVTFDNDIEFSDPGTYKLVIKEVAGNDQDIEYDATEYEYTLVVSDTGRGTLMVEYEGGAEEAIFVNRLVGGKGEEPKNPKTFDDITTSISIFSASILGLIASAIYIKRKAKAEK